MSRKTYQHTVSGSFTSHGLADSFAEIEKYDLMVKSVKMHPTNMDKFVGQDYGEIFDKDGDKYSIWGASVILDTSLSTDFVVLEGGTDETTAIVTLRNTEELTQKEFEESRRSDESEGFAVGKFQLLASVLTQLEAEPLVDLMEEADKISQIVEILEERGIVERPARIEEQGNINPEHMPTGDE